jgi:argininosuccinate synthase
VAAEPAQVRFELAYYPLKPDANLLHASSEGNVLEDPAQEVPDYVYSRTLDPEQAPDEPTCLHG